MKGRILDLGIISGDDGNRYSFILDDIKNLDNYNKDKLANLTVDFEIDDKKAINIYIISNEKIEYASNILSNIRDNISNSNINKIRFIAIASVVLGIFSQIPILGAIFAIISLILYLLVAIDISKISQSKTILRNFIIYFLVGIVFLILLTFAIGAIIISITMSNGISSIGFGTIFLILIIFIAIIAKIIFGLLFTRELSYLTGQKVFLWAFYASIIAIFTTKIFILGFIFTLIAIILNIYGWLNTVEIKQSEKSENMPWI